MALTSLIVRTMLDFWKILKKRVINVKKNDLLVFRFIKKNNLIVFGFIIKN